MRKTRGNLSLLLLASILITLVFAVILKQQSINTASAEAAPRHSSVSEDGSHFISIFDDGKRINVRSDAGTVRDALLRANITLNVGDKVEPALEEQILADDYNINIYRAIERLVIDEGKKKPLVLLQRISWLTPA